MLEEDKELFEEIKEQQIFVRIGAPHKYRQQHDLKELINSLQERLELIETQQEKISSLQEEVNSLQEELERAKNTANTEPNDEFTPSENAQQP
jgi:DNA repair ATPase RecN